MATINTGALANEAQLERDLRRMLTAAPSLMRTGLRKLGQVVEKRAQAYAPISPKLEQLSANLTRGAVKRGAKTNISINPNTGVVSIKSSTLKARRKDGVNPGKLQDNTKVQKVAATDSQAYVEIGVASNSDAGRYAHYIHDQGPHGTRKWKKPGIGTRAKPGAGDKFIERAVDDTGAEQVKILTTTVDRWFKSGGF